MAQEVVRRFKCDRCKKPYDEQSPEAPADPKRPKVIFTVESFIPHEKQTTSPEVVKFEDLCPKCHGRVLDLLSAIRLDKGTEDEKNAKPTDAQSEAKEGVTPPADPAAAPKPDAKKEDKGKRAGGSAEPSTTH